MLCLVVGNFFSAEDKAVTRKNAGHDFVAFYTAGHFVRTGQLDKIYNLPDVIEFQRKLASTEALEIGDTVGPFWNPPFFALPFVPLSKLHYHTAWDTWFFINAACGLAAIALLSRIIAQTIPDWRYWALVPTLTLVSLPFIQALSHGQNTCLSLLLLTSIITLWRADRLFLAGVVSGLLFYKPQLAMLVAAALIILAGRRALLGIAVTGATLLGITLIALPGTLADFLARLPKNIVYMQIDHVYQWERHVTLKAFWRFLFQGYALGDMTTIARLCWIISAALLGGWLLYTLWQARKSTDPLVHNRAMAATICAMPLLMPFYFDYDLLLLTVPAVLYAADRLQTGDDRRTLTAWVALFVWQYFNAAGSGRTHVNISVLLLTVLAGMLIIRTRRTIATRKEEKFDPAPLRQAA